MQASLNTTSADAVPDGLEANFTKEAYLDAARKAKEYIAAEEIYHLELCNGSRTHPMGINQPLASR